MDKPGIFLASLVFLVTISGTVSASDIEASITNQWGGSLVPIKIFGQEASVGEVVQGDLKLF